MEELLNAKTRYEELIARMDADDISLPNRFEIQHKYFQKGCSKQNGMKSPFELYDPSQMRYP